jgi:hypothetical protein
MMAFMNSLRLVICAVVLALCNYGRSQSDLDRRLDTKGSWLYHVCSAHVRGQDASKPDSDDLALALHCNEYIDGFIDGMTSSPTPRPFCPSPETNENTIIRVYVAFMKGNPKLMDAYRGIGFLLAMKKNYPCTNKE